MNDLITQVNDAIWGYVLIGALVLCGLWFTWKTKGVQSHPSRLSPCRWLPGWGRETWHE